MKNWPLATVVSGVRRSHLWYRKFESVPLHHSVPIICFCILPLMLLLKNNDPHAKKAAAH
jgi:hypothetical protein